MCDKSDSSSMRYGPSCCQVDISANVRGTINYISEMMKANREATILLHHYNVTLQMIICFSCRMTKRRHSSPPQLCSLKHLLQKQSHKAASFPPCPSSPTVNVFCNSCIVSFLLPIADDWACVFSSPRWVLDDVSNEQSFSCKSTVGSPDRCIKDKV